MTDARLSRERDLYRRLLDLGTRQELDPLLQDALALVVEATGARIGYLEVQGEQDERAPRWSKTHQMTDDELEDARATISRSIVAEAMATGETIVTPAAYLDPRFRTRGSVEVARIEAVLCVPIGADPPVGVLYLQGEPDGGPLQAEAVEMAEIFARQLAPLADRLLAKQRKQPDATRKFRAMLALDDVIGRSEPLAALFAQIALVAPLDISVLLGGQSGTGKSQIARVIHDNSVRRRQPFIEINCAALPENLIESELFGALPGAHSTAHRRQDGKVAAAERGTLFLDEVGDLSLPAQAKLLQLLQSKQYYPLGASKPVTADVRVVAATNTDLERAVAEHRFREDLFYRLQVLPVRVPSLAERREDIGDLAAFFCEAACTRHSLAKVALATSAVRAAEAAEWPGNIRQLAHAVEAAVIRAVGQGAAQVERAHLFPEATTSGAPPAAEPLTFQESTRRHQAGLLRAALEENDWNVSEVARRLDLTRSHVYNLIRAFGLERGT